ncbi:MAG: SDR family NAD(P)-dependent oxidoreductase, partial [Hyphomicrobiales bacterium]|nr:SDR family NAD(P)-dependent oxidoreductase [Hyphomicrobiales bacterium]
MSDFLKNPLGLFDVKGKVAVVTGASGAFGALAAKILAGAGCKLVLTAGSKQALDEVAKECQDLGADVEALNMRPTTSELCDEVIAA